MLHLWRWGGEKCLSPNQSNHLGEERYLDVSLTFQHLKESIILQDAAFKLAFQMRLLLIRLLQVKLRRKQVAETRVLCPLEALSTSGRVEVRTAAALGQGRSGV